MHDMVLQFFPIKGLRQKFISTALDNFHPGPQHPFIKLGYKDHLRVRSFALYVRKQAKRLFERLTQAKNNDIDPPMHNHGLHRLFGRTRNHNRLILAECVCHTPYSSGVLPIENGYGNYMSHWCWLS